MTISAGGVPRRSGQWRRTVSWSAPMPPEVTITAWAVSSNSPAASRLEATPRGESSGARTVPRTPRAVPPSTTRWSTRWRWWKVSSPSRTACFAYRTNGSTTPVPVPHAMWNRGTELPCPPARRSPRSAQPTVGRKVMPCPASQDRFSPAAHSTYARAQRTAQESSSSVRSKAALPRQSFQARSKESLTPRRRCSGESTRKRPPKDQNACPPRLAAFSWSTRATLRPRLVSSWAATRPASPAPTTMTSASMATVPSLFRR